MSCAFVALGLPCAGAAAAAAGGQAGARVKRMSDGTVAGLVSGRDLMVEAQHKRKVQCLFFGGHLHCLMSPENTNSPLGPICGMTFMQAKGLP